MKYPRFNKTEMSKQDKELFDICKLCKNKFIPKYYNSTKCDDCRKKNRMKRKKEMSEAISAAIF